MKLEHTPFYRTWLDILPADIQTLIWKKVYDQSMEKIVVFGSYKAIVKSYFSRHLLSDNIIKTIIVDNSDNFIQYNNDNCIYRCCENVKYYRIISHLLSPSTEWTSKNNDNNEIYYSEKDYYRDKFNTVKIFDKNIVNTLSKIYMLCKFVPNDWDKIGRWENLAATRYTRFISES